MHWYFVNLIEILVESLNGRGNSTESILKEQRKYLLTDSVEYLIQYQHITVRA